MLRKGDINTLNSSNAYAIYKNHLKKNFKALKSNLILFSW